MSRKLRFGAYVILSIFAACTHDQKISTTQRSPASVDSDARVGIVVIDVQKSFFSNAANENLPAVRQNIKQLFQLADQFQVPFFITYEGTTSGDHAIPNELKQALPRHHQDFIKTTFAATGLTSFARAIESSRLTHLIVIGSETDVCVLQTVLGLRSRGVQVLVAKDAVFSSEYNPEPAFRRMTAAGVRLVNMEEARQIMESKPLPGPATPAGENSIILPIINGELNVALVLNFLDEVHIARSSDKFKREKLQRLRELLLLSEWLQIPTYVQGLNSEYQSIPEELRKILGVKAMEVLKKRKWHSLADFPADKFSQVFVAGTDEHIDKILSDLGNRRQIFLLEDALLTSTVKSSAKITMGGIVPLTYKSLYYGMIKSISPDEWPTRSWAAKEDTFDRIMTAPEQLMPIKY